MTPSSPRISLPVEHTGLADVCGTSRCTGYLKQGDGRFEMEGKKLDAEVTAHTKEKLFDMFEVFYLKVYL